MPHSDRERCLGTKMDVPVSWTEHVHKQLEKGLDYREIGDKFGVGASAACEKVNAASTDENLFRLVPVPWHGTRVVPLELVPRPGHGARVVSLELVPRAGHGARVVPLELVPRPGHSAQIYARAPTKCSDLVPVLGH